jgi:hypothetical protein
VQNTAAPATGSPGLHRQLFVNAQQQAEKIGRLQEGVAHLNGL